MKHAIKEAEITLVNADNAATDMAKLLVGRLRSVGGGYYSLQILVDLKKELR